jgi:hypothetical protein
MTAWLARQTEVLGALWYRDDEPPGAEAFAVLADRGFTIDVVPPDPVAEARGETEGAWALTIRHPARGRLALGAIAHQGKPPVAMASAQPMGEDDRSAALACRSYVIVRFDAPGRDFLAERKDFLFLAAAAAQATGAVVIADMTAARLWSRSDLADELAHAAPLDLGHLFSVHRVVEAEGAPPVWVHTEGLAALGIAELDFVPPALGKPFWEDAEAPRMMAALQLEGRLKVGGPAFPFLGPQGFVRLVATDDFLARGRGAEPLKRLLAADGGAHGGPRAVPCEPEAGGLSRLFGRSGPAPFAALWTDDPPPVMVYCSAETTALMAARARGTFARLRALHAEFAGLGFTTAAKLAVPVRVAGDPGAVEHMWFEVHGFDDDGLDATLAVQPFAPCEIGVGHRGRRPAAALDDWLIATPFGRITPRDQAAAHFVRAHRAEIEAAARNLDEERARGR